MTTYQFAFFAQCKYTIHCVVCTASSDHVARLWHVDKTDPVREYQGHTKAVTALAYNDSR